MPTFDSYVICTSPRSGSTLLCDILSKSGVAGKPDSHFHRPDVSAWANYVGLEHGNGEDEQNVLNEVFRRIIAKGRADTGVFGLRLQRHSFDYFMEKLDVLHPGLPSDAERFRAMFGRTLFVHLTRTDKVDQAVSLVRAEQTGLWHAAPDGTEIERNSPPQDPSYDAEEIRARFDELREFDRQWTNWFSSEQIEPHRIDYQTLAAEPIATLRTLLEALGQDNSAAANVTPGVAKLADEISADWSARFRADHDLTGTVRSC